MSRGWQIPDKGKRSNFSQKEGSVGPFGHKVSRPKEGPRHAHVQARTCASEEPAHAGFSHMWANTSHKLFFLFAEFRVLLDLGSGAQDKDEDSKQAEKNNLEEDDWTARHIPKKKSLSVREEVESKKGTPLIFSHVSYCFAVREGIPSHGITHKDWPRRIRLSS